MASEAERIVQLIKTRRIIKVWQMLGEALAGNVEQITYAMKTIGERLIHLNSSATDDSGREGETKKQSSFQIGDMVAVKPGVKDPYMGGDIGGWQGRIEEVDVDEGVITIRWDGADKFFPY